MVLLELDPNVVKPGWIPLIITILLLGAIVFLYRSMRKQLGRIEAPYAADVRKERTDPDPRSSDPASEDSKDPTDQSQPGTVPR